MQLVKNSFFAPYFIFIKDHSSLTDEELLKQFELKGYQLITDEYEKRSQHNIDQRYLYITEDKK